MRITPQRAHIWRVLAESRAHLSAEEIRERVRSLLPGLEISTVYRTLEALGEAGLVTDSRLPEGPRVFEARPALHPHLRCESCGEIFHPEEEIGTQLLEALRTGGLGGFEVHKLHVVAEGLCAKCTSVGR